MQHKDKKQKTRDRILSSAAEIFSEVGFAGARVDEIAARAQVNKAAIYYHIGDKEALYHAVLRYIVRITADRISRRIVSATSPEEKLSIYIRMLVQRADENPHLPRIMMREVAAGGKYFPREFIDDFIHLIGLLDAILEEGVVQNVFIKTAPVLIHFMIIGTFSFSKTSRGLITRFTTDGKVDPDRIPYLPDNVVPEIEKLILNAVKKEKTV